jgi:hypothetical protein
MSADQNQYKRSLLYYPTIKIPSGQWLKQTILYWDEVGSIVPRDLNGTWLIPMSDDLKYLAGEEIFYPYDPRWIEGNWEISQLFFDELCQNVQSDSFLRLVPRAEQRLYDAKIHWNKVSEQALNFLLTNELVKLTTNQRKFFLSNGGSGRGKVGKWIYFERTTALLYMSLLAKYLVRCDDRKNVIATPATDRPEYQFLSFKQEQSMDQNVGIEISIKDWLPVPDEHVPILEIVAFKRKRQDELIPLQLLMTSLEKKLKGTISLEEAKEIAYQFDLKKRKGLSDLSASLKDSKLETKWESLNLLIGVTAPPLVGFLAGKIAEVTQIADPVATSVIAFGLSASIALKAYFVARQSAVNEKLRNSPYSYLFHAQQELIISG